MRIPAFQMDRIDIDRLRELLDAGLPVTSIAATFGVNKKTVYRYMKYHSITRERFTDINDDDLHTLLKSIKENHPNDGEILMQGHLLSQNPPVRVARSRLRSALRDIDPDGIKQRQSKKHHRRAYSVPCPHYLWHLDGNLKAIRYKMVVHGGIDGMTRTIVFLNVSDNNRSETVLSYFQKAVVDFGWPIRIRTDYGGENSLVWDEMINKRGYPSALAGSSVHNQPIEQLWNEINIKCTGPFKQLFLEMEQCGELNVENSTDVMCLHWTFLPVLQSVLTEYAYAHNRHKISTENGRTPLQLNTLYKHLKLPYEEGGHVADDVVLPHLRNPAEIPEPLPHVTCSVLDSFGDELKELLHPLGKATNRDNGRQLYKEVKKVVRDYMLHHQ